VVFHIKGRTQTEGVSEHGDGNIWTYEVIHNGRLKKAS
jgi:hypothetical protein